jgi:hypothetical protein
MPRGPKQASRNSIHEDQINVGAGRAGIEDNGSVLADSQPPILTSDDRRTRPSSYLSVSPGPQKHQL